MISSDIFVMPDDVEEMDEQRLRKYIQKNDDLIEQRYKPLWNAYINDYEIFHKKPKARWKPDARLSINFAKAITDTFEGFFIGNPVRTHSDDPTVSAYVNYIGAYNDQETGDSELSRIVSIFGRGYELYYTDEEGMLCIAHLDPTDAFMVYDESIKPRPRYFVRVFQREDKRRYGSISDNYGVRYFALDSDEFWLTDWDPHLFNTVPANEFVLNEARRGLYEDSLHNIDMYNETVSEKANDVSYFADSYMKITGAELDEKTINYMRDNRIINFEARNAQDVDIDFLAKPNGDATQEHLLDRLEKKIFTVSNVINMDDDHAFATTSGEALKYKLLNMMNLFKTKERFFAAGLHRRYKILFGNPVSKVSADSWTTLSFTFTPNIPSDLSEELDAVSKGVGIVSQRTLLKMVSAVDDVDKEMEEIKKEQAKETEYETEYETKRTKTELEKKKEEKEIDE